MAGRIAIVTGGASGIGAALCRALAASGDTVVVADRDAVGAERVARSSPRATSREVDVIDAGAVRDLVAETCERHGRLDLMVNNAGIGLGGPIEELTLAHWDRVVDINVRGVVHGVVAAYPVMQAQGSGHIVNTASLAGLIPAPMLAPYAMSKHAVVGLSLSLRPEAAQYGIRVTAVCPGPVDTPILDRTSEPGLPDLPLRGLGREFLSAFATPYDAEAMARDILRGIERNDALVVAPGSARLAWWMNRLSPDVFLRLATRQVRWMRDRLDAAVGAPGEPAAASDAG